MLSETEDSHNTLHLEFLELLDLDLGRFDLDTHPIGR